MATMQASSPSTYAVVKGWAERTPDAVALTGPGRTPLTYERLASQIDRTVRALNTLGVGRGDRVAVALPQGPEMAAAFLAISAGAVAALLNPTLGAGECESALSQLDPKAVIVPSGIESSGAWAAQAGGWPVIQLAPLSDGAAGEFTLSGSRLSGPLTSGVGEPDELAVMLSTSGTTSRPRWVPLTHRNILAAADNTRAALGLTQHDRCLNVMPLFHGHGLVAGVLAPIMAGGSMVCTTGFDPVRFFGWLDEARPTWFTAVPTMHKAIVAEAPRHREIIARSALRFVRSASAPLAAALRSQVEAVFRVVVTESYGLSEALQLTNTPLDPRVRKIGSLGITGGSELAIMDEAGRLLGPDELGEIVCRGPVVMAGYYNDPAANEDCFQDSWFRTGDQGFLDTDGHLYMTGRLKETINRGGEKVFPAEVDEALIAHPAVAEAATFGLPDPALGEEVAIAVVLRPGPSVTAGELREFAAARLTEFKVPRRVFIVPAIPLGPTGKVQRRELPTRLGLLGSDGIRLPANSAGEALKPRNLLEYQLTLLWEELFGIRPLGTTDDFFDLGGTSLLAARMMEEIEKTYGRSLHPSILFSASTVQRLARRLEAEANPDPGERPLTEIQRGGRRRPFVYLHGHYIGGGVYCRDLARWLDPHQPFYTLSPYAIGGPGAPTTIKGLAEAYLRTLRAAQPAGPYFLGGYSHAGLVAFEMARRLLAAGEKVPLLAVLDVPVRDPSIRAATREFFTRWAHRVRRLAELARGGPRPVLAFASEKIVGKREPAPASTEARLAAEGAAVGRIFGRMIERYVPGPYAGRVTLFTSADGPAARTGDPTLGWRRVVADLRVIRLPGDHTTCITEHADVLARQLQACLDEAGA
jgi:acyl-CoA synthetase (AMP-forming)/AMP-acid ligase II/thioesterase domain-containing protein